MTFSFRPLAIKKLFPSLRKSKEATVTPRTQLDRSGLPSETLAGPRKPRLAGGVKWHNMKGNYPSGKLRRVAGELQIADH